MTNFDPSTRKVSKIFILMGSFWAKYILLELKKYRGIMLWLWLQWICIVLYWNFYRVWLFLMIWLGPRSRTERFNKVCMFFGCCCGGLVSGMGTGHWAMYSPKFEISLISPKFLSPKVLSRSATFIPSLLNKISSFVLLVAN